MMMLLLSPLLTLLLLLLIRLLLLLLLRLRPLLLPPLLLLLLLLLRLLLLRLLLHSCLNAARRPNASHACDSFPRWLSSSSVVIAASGGVWSILCTKIVALHLRVFKPLSKRLHSKM
jgi:hypothetical protein